MEVDGVQRAQMLATAPGIDLRAVVLVEGTSDRTAVEALAARRGRDLLSEGIHVVPIGGARSIRRFVALFGPLGLDVRLAGLCDAGEEDDFRRGLHPAGLGSDLDRDDIEALGVLRLCRRFGGRVDSLSRHSSGRAGSRGAR